MGMKFQIKIGDKSTEIEVNEAGIEYTSTGQITRIAIEDVIGLHKSEDEDNLYNLYYIQEQPDNKLTKETETFTADNNVFDRLKKTVTSKIWTVTGRPKKVVIFVNSVGGKFQGKQICKDEVVPVLSLAGIETDIIASERPSHATEFAETYDFKTVDGVVIMGGDGTASDICNVLLKSTQIEAGVDVNDPNATLKKMELPIAFLPTGGWNGIANAIHGCKDVLTSTLHIVKGSKSEGQVHGSFSGGELIGYSTLAVGYGLQHEIAQSISYYRWFGFIRTTFIFLWYIIFRPFREIDVEMTYEYLAGNHSNEMNEGEKTIRKVTKRKKIISLLAFSYNFDIDDVSTEQQVQKDHFDLLEYQMCSRFALRRHYRRFAQLFSKENRDDAKDFVTYSKVSAFHLRVFENNEKGKNEMDYFWNVDGETRQLQTPEVYVKLFPRCYTVFSSYKGPTRWR